MNNETQTLANGVQSTFKTASHQLSDGYDSARESLRTASSEIESFVKRNPISCVLVSAGIGLVIGRVLSRRMSKNT